MRILLPPLDDPAAGDEAADIQTFGGREWEEEEYNEEEDEEDEEYAGEGYDEGMWESDDEEEPQAESVGPSIYSHG